MLVDNVGDMTITNDGATILSLLEVTHPAVSSLARLEAQADEQGPNLGIARYSAGQGSWRWNYLGRPTCFGITEKGQRACPKQDPSNDRHYWIQVGVLRMGVWQSLTCLGWHAKRHVDSWLISYRPKSTNSVEKHSSMSQGHPCRPRSSLRMSLMKRG
jgi:hypothetical protein